MFFIVNTHPNRLELLISIMFLVTAIAENMCSNKSYDRRETVVWHAVPFDIPYWTPVKQTYSSKNYASLTNNSIKGNLFFFYLLCKLDLSHVCSSIQVQLHKSNTHLYQNRLDYWEILGDQLLVDMKNPEHWLLFNIFINQGLLLINLSACLEDPKLHQLISASTLCNSLSFE